MLKPFDCLAFSSIIPNEHSPCLCSCICSSPFFFFFFKVTLLHYPSVFRLASLAIHTPCDFIKTNKYGANYVKMHWASDPWHAVSNVSALNVDILISQDDLLEMHLNHYTHNTLSCQISVATVLPTLVILSYTPFRDLILFYCRLNLFSYPVLFLGMYCLSAPIFYF